MGTDEQDSYFDPEYIYAELRRTGATNYIVENGVSKAVIIFDDYDFVIKTPINGMWYYPEPEYNEEEDAEEELEYPDPIFDTFTGAEADDSSDYCWDEVKKIEWAYCCGFEALFPQTAFLVEVNNRRYYIQEKVQTVREYKPKVSEESRTRAENMDDQYCHGSKEWRAAIIENYGEDFWIRFCEWDRQVGTMSDMHSGNYGYSMDGKPIILDASGFNS